MKKQSLVFLISSLFFVQLLAMDKLPSQLYCSDEDNTIYVTFNKKNEDGKMHFHVRICQEHDFYGKEINVSKEDSISVSKKMGNKVLTMTLLLPPNIYDMARFDADFHVRTFYLDVGATPENDPNLEVPKITKLLCSKF